MGFLQISPDDEYSKYICLACYNKVTKHYDFMQSVLEYSKDKVNVTKINSSYEVKDEDIETEAISKLHSDMIYTCPNCNVDLMIVISSNPEGCNYALHISLAVVNEIEKSAKESNVQIENMVNLDNTNMKKSSIIDELHESSCIITNGNDEDINEVNENSLGLEKGTNYDTHMLLKEDVSHQASRGTKRKLQENLTHETTVDLSKSLKIEMELNDARADELNAESLICAYETVDDLMKNVEPVNDNVEWLNGEIDCKEDDSTVYTTETERERVDEEVKCEDTDVKSSPKIICNLCGARYLSQLKYEFHMERHKLDKMDRYICTVCDKEASSENLLWDHYFYTHKSSVRYACTSCGRLFQKKARLKGHQKRHKHSGIKEVHFETSIDEANVDQEARRAIAIEIQERSDVNCSLCRKPITDLDPDGINDLVTCAACEESTLSLMVDGSEMKAISPRQYHCSKCPKHFVRKERLEFHEMRHNENMNEFICSTCGKEFSAENSLYEHYLFVHKGARPHVCELCGKSFQLKARLKEHHRTHTGERPYQCDVCGQRCMTTNALKLHRKTHFSHNRYACKICDKSFSKKQNMNEHLEKHWKNDRSVSLPQLFTCPVCMEGLPTYRMLKYHMMENHQIGHQDPLLTRQKPWYECDECHEKFKHQMSLKAHKERVHEGRVSPIFQCDACDATYKIKQLLINHIRSKHDGEKRYKCAQCGKGFNDTKSLYNHVLLHTGRKPFVCEYCNMSFRRKDSRDHHRRRHTGEQPYPCPDCDQSFSTYNNRSKHRKKEHGVGETGCPECGEKCSSQQEIRMHLNKHLGEKLSELECV